MNESEHFDTVGWARRIYQPTAKEAERYPEETAAYWAAIVALFATLAKREGVE